MFSEKRRGTRVETHIFVELEVFGETRKLFDYFTSLGGEASRTIQGESSTIGGYIQNLCEGGMGIVSLEALIPGTIVNSSFMLIHPEELVRVQARVRHVSMRDLLHYYGLQFDPLNERQHKLIRQFVKQGKPLLV